MISKARNSVSGICLFFQRLDSNSSHGENLEQRLEYADDIRNEIVYLTEVSCEWYDSGFLTVDEFKWLMETLESANHELEL